MYHEQEFSVIRLGAAGAGKKRPSLKSWREFQTRKASISEIEGWWPKNSNSNIGIVTGQISGIIVLDIDTPNGLDFVKSQGIPDTAICETSRGKHIYFKHPGFRVKNKNYKSKDWDCPGCDLRGDGGYVVAPPSLHPDDTKYTWIKSPFEVKIAPIPEWLHNLIDLEATDEIIIDDKNQNRSDYTADNKRIQGEYFVSKALKKALIGNRNITGFELACQLRDEGLSKPEAGLFMKEYANNVPHWANSEYTLREAFASLDQAYSRPPRPPAIRKKEPFLIRLMKAIEDDDQLGKNERSILIWIAYHDWSNGENTYPSQDTLAKHIGICKTTLQIYLKKMKGNGWLDFHKVTGMGRGRSHTVYKLSIPKSIDDK